MCYLYCRKRLWSPFLVDSSQDKIMTATRLSTSQRVVRNIGGRGPAGYVRNQMEPKAKKKRRAYGLKDVTST